MRKENGFIRPFAAVLAFLMMVSSVNAEDPAPVPEETPTTEVSGSRDSANSETSSTASELPEPSEETSLPTDQEGKYSSEQPSDAFSSDEKSGEDTSYTSSLIDWDQALQTINSGNVYRTDTMIMGTVRVG